MLIALAPTPHTGLDIKCELAYPHPLLCDINYQQLSDSCDSLKLVSYIPSRIHCIHLINPLLINALK